MPAGTTPNHFAVGAYVAAHHALGRPLLPAWTHPLPWLALAVLLATLGLVIAIALAMLTRRLVEAPVLLLKRHLHGTAWTAPAP